MLTTAKPEQTQGQARQENAQSESDASHATAKVPGATATTSGVVTKDDPDRSAGSWNQTVGAAKEAVGGAIGSQVGSNCTHFRLEGLRHQER